MGELRHKSARPMMYGNSAGSGLDGSETLSSSFNRSARRSEGCRAALCVSPSSEAPPCMHASAGAGLSCALHKHVHLTTHHKYAGVVSTLCLQAALLAGYTMVYVFMQTFAIPGTVSLSLLSGALFGILRGLLLVAGPHSASCACLPSVKSPKPWATNFVAVWLCPGSRAAMVQIDDWQCAVFKFYVAAVSKPWVCVYHGSMRRADP